MSDYKRAPDHTAHTNWSPTPQSPSKAGATGDDADSPTSTRQSQSPRLRQLPCCQKYGSNGSSDTIPIARTPSSISGRHRNAPLRHPIAKCQCGRAVCGRRCFCALLPYCFAQYNKRRRMSSRLRARNGQVRITKCPEKQS